MYKQITASLEKWVENPVASIQPYAAMRRIYPTNHSESNDKEEVPSLNRCVNFNLYHVNKIIVDSYFLLSIVQYI